MAIKKRFLLIGIMIFFVICYITNISRAEKIEAVIGETAYGGATVKIKSEQNIHVLKIYKKTSNEKYILIGIVKGSNAKEVSFKISRIHLSTENATEIIIVSYDENNNINGTAKGEIPKLPKPKEMNPEETAKPSWSASAVPTKPTPTTSVSTSPSASPSEVPAPSTSPSGSTTPSGTAATITGIKLNKNTVTLKVGQKDKLTYTVTPEGVRTHLTWRTEASDICKIEADGTITGISVGETKISIRSDNDIKDVCDVKVIREETPTQNGTNSSTKVTGGQAIAEAAVSLACTSSSKSTLRVDWPDTRIYNEQTKAYVDARERLIEGHNVGKDGPPLRGDYASCDMGVATAVRYSGVDQSFEYKEIPAQWPYLRNSSQWQIVGEFKGTPNDVLKPGDVLINNHHIMLYCGKEIVQAKYPGSDGELYEAGFWTEKGMSYYPRLVPLSSRNSDASENPYTIFRNANWDKAEYNKIL